VGLDLKIVGGVVVTDGTAQALDVGIEGDVVAEVGPPGSLGPVSTRWSESGRDGRVLNASGPAGSHGIRGNPRPTA